MTLRINHSFRSPLPDDPIALQNGEICPQSHWNDTHLVSGTVPLSQIDMLPAHTVLGNPLSFTAPPTIITDMQLAQMLGVDPPTLMSLQKQIYDLNMRIMALEEAVAQGEGAMGPPGIPGYTGK